MRTARLLIAISSFVFMFGATIRAQTPTPTPSPTPPECDVPSARPVDKRARILAKPDPKFSPRDRDKYRNLGITLRANLCGTGKVTDIVVTSGLTATMNAQAIEAARLIQFTPAEKDGKKASTAVTLKYFVNN